MNATITRRDIIKHREREQVTVITRWVVNINAKTRIQSGAIYRINRAFCLLQAWSRMSSRVGERDMMSAGETRGWRMRRGTVVSCDHCYDTVREKGCSTVKGDKTRGTLEEVHVQVTERLRRVCLSNSGWDADDHESRLPPAIPERWSSLKPPRGSRTIGIPEIKEKTE